MPDGYIDLWRNLMEPGERVSLLVGDRPGDVAFSSFDAYSQADAAVIPRNANTSTLRLYFDARFGVELDLPPGQLLPAGDLATAIISADFNSDNVPDLVVASQLQDSALVYFGSAVTVGNPDDRTEVRYTDLFSDPTSYSVSNGVGAPPGPHDIIAADVNSDGVEDLVTANLEDGTISVLLGNGNAGQADGTFVRGLQIDTVDFPLDLQAVDLDKDGIEDIVAFMNFDLSGTSGISNYAAYFRGQGTGAVGGGTFDTPIGFRMGTWGFAGSMFVDDLDHDGVLDIAMADDISAELLFGIQLGEIEAPLPGDYGGPDTGVWSFGQFESFPVSAPNAVWDAASGMFTGPVSGVRSREGDRRRGAAVWRLLRRARGVHGPSHLRP